MQNWEYLEVFFDYASNTWQDSMGRRGELDVDDRFKHAGKLLNELGQQGWELVGLEFYPNSSGGTIYGAYLAKWVFKRPSGPGA